MYKFIITNLFNTYKRNISYISELPFMGPRIKVIKESGETEFYNHSKVQQAIRRAGLSAKAANYVLGKLEPQLYDGITTKKIYMLLYKLIDERKPEVSHKYNLKRALMEIGPAGYEFEDFVARLLTLEGYRTELRQILQGKCVSHEIDIVAANRGDVFMTECKFHSSGGIKTRIQDALYTYARFLDLVEGAKLGRCRKFTKPWLISNTKFSNDVKDYAACAGFPLLGWHYPMEKSLEHFIEKRKCYPVSVIPMSRKILAKLLRKKIVTVFDLPESPVKLEEITGVTKKTAKSILEKAEYAR
jgi:Holliday junction resolvase-like predicted endonuclease